MYSSATAAWLDIHFSGFDHLFLSIQHWMADHAGAILTPLMRVITFLGEKGWPFFLLALLFMLLADRRDLGVCIFGAVCCGALITNIILKDNIARVRPFESGNVEYELWWLAVGSPAEDGFSFPSGHVTACAAGMTAITLMRGKKWIVPSAVVVLMMMISRNYLMAHYPSDVAAALIIGVFSGVVAWLITKLIFRVLRKTRRRFALSRFLLEFDLRDILPFELPLLGRRRAKEPAARPAAKTGEAAPAPARRRSAPAAEPAAAVQAPAPAARASRVSEPKAESAAPARTGGRHAMPEGAVSAAKKKAPANYQGKH